MNGRARLTWSNIKYDFKDATVLVTGGTSGIGAAIAAAFLEAGANVTITGTRASAQDYDADLSAYRYLRLDVEDNAAIDAVAEAMETCDVLVNNAGMSFGAIGLDERDPDVFARAIQVHLISGQRLANRLQPKLSQSKLPGGASIIGIGSITSFVGLHGTLGYGAGKTGILGLARGLSVDVGHQGIRANVVAAGLVETPMTSSAFVDDGKHLQPFIDRTPMGFMGNVYDIAGAVLFVASDAARWITGQVISVDGGYTING